MKTTNNTQSSVAINAGGGGDNNNIRQSLEDGNVLAPISNPLGEEKAGEDDGSVDLLANFVQRMVPFYAQCLIEVRGFFFSLFRQLFFIIDHRFIYFYRIPWTGSSVPPNFALLIQLWFAVPQ